MPLLLIPDEAPTMGEGLAALSRLLFRYRSELAPVWAVVWLTVAGWWLHRAHPDRWLWVALTAAVVAVAVVVMPAGWAPGWVVLDRRSRRAYTAGLTAAAGAWLAAATAQGPGAGMLPTVLVVGASVLAVPWWANHRRRARVRVERTLAEWPEVADAVGLAGSRLSSAMVTAWGFVARLRLVRGQTVTDVLTRVPAMESALRLRPGSLRVEPEPQHADQAVVRVLERDPHAEPIPWPVPDRPGSIERPIELGVWEDGSPVLLRLLYRHVLIGGMVGAGKSGVVNVILAALSGCADVRLWGVDLKGGMELRPWAACLRRLATTPADAVTLLRAAVAELDRRAAVLAELGLRLWTATEQSPALVLVIDEYAELPDDAHTLADSIARRGRAVAVTLLIATQRPTQAAMGHGAVRSQMDVRIALRVRERRDTDLILGHGMYAAGWRPDLVLNAAGKLLLLAPEHTNPRPARAYLLTDQAVTTTAQRHANHPTTDTTTDAGTTDEPDQPDEPDEASNTGGRHRAPADPTHHHDDPVWQHLCHAGPTGTTVPDLVTATGLSRATIYRRLATHAHAGRAEQLGDATWRATL